MKTEITKDRLSEYFYPTQNFQRTALDNVIVDYAEIEIDTKGIKKLEDNLERCTEKSYESTEWQREITNPESDSYEHIIAYVHFDAGTDNFNKLFIEVHTAYNNDQLDVDKLINKKEKQNIIDTALESIHKWRDTDKVINSY